MPFAEFRDLDHRIWSLAAARAVVTAGFSVVLPLLAMHLTVERGLPAFAVGVIWTAAGGCGAAMQWLAGALSDRIGRRRVILGAMLVRAVNMAGLGWAAAQPARDADALTFGLLIVLNAALRAFFDPVANALVADLAPPARRVSAFALQRVGVNIGWAAGTGMAFVAARASYSTLFYFSVPITLIATAVLWRIREPAPAVVAGAAPTPTAPRWRDLFLGFRGDRAFVRFLIATVAFYVLQVQLYQTLSIYAARSLHLDRAQVPTLYLLNGVLVVFLQLPAIAYIRRIGTHGALVLGCIGYAASYAAVGLASGHVSLLLCVAAVTLAEIVTAPAQQVTVAALAPSGRMGSYSGLFGLAQVVGQSTGPLIGTLLLDTVPPRASWFLLALFGVVAAVGYRSAEKAAAPATTPANNVVAKREKA